MAPRELKITISLDNDLIKKTAKSILSEYKKQWEWEKHIKFLDDQCDKWVIQKDAHFYRPL